MKNLLFFLSVTLMFSSCDFFNADDDVDISITPQMLIPDSALSFIEDNYPGYEIQSAETEDICDDVNVYEVELEDGPGSDVDLYFDLNWEFLFTAREIAATDLPDVVLTTIEMEFSGYTIDQVERWELADGSLQYKVELESTPDSDVDVVFNADGTVYCTDDGNDDDDENDDDDDDENGESIDISTLPTSVTDFINQNYDGYTIQSAETEDICDDVNVYEVELEDGPGSDVDLYFDLNWEFLFTAREIAATDLPDVVLTTIEMEFSGYTIDQVERWELADGSLQYKVELESTPDSDVDVVFNADGTVYCTDDGNDDDDENDDDDDDENGESIDISTLPTSVTDFINQNYDGYTIQSVETEDICDDVNVYEVELEDGPGSDVDLYFDLNWEFLFTAREIAAADLPDAVLLSIETGYSGYSIEKAERWESADGSLQYEVELESTTDADLEILFNEDGSIECIDN